MAAKRLSLPLKVLGVAGGRVDSTEGLEGAPDTPATAFRVATP
jgi:hypothetical protein